MQHALIRCLSSAFEMPKLLKEEMAFLWCAVWWRSGRRVYKWSDRMRKTRWEIITELDTWAGISQVCAVFMEAAYGSSQACIPSIALWHTLCYCINPIGVRKCLIVYNFPRLCYAKNSNLCSFQNMVFRANRRIAAYITHNSAMDCAGPGSNTYCKRKYI